NHVSQAIDSAFKRINFLASGRIPSLQGFSRDAQQAIAVGGECDSLFRLWDGKEVLSGRYVPQLNGIVGAGAGESLTVRTKSQPSDGAGVSGKRAKLFTSSGIPDPDFPRDKLAFFYGVAAPA